MFIIDFDATLFDTYRFAQDRMAALKKIGISKELYQSTYLLARNHKDGFVAYSDYRHAQFLAQNGFDEDLVFKALAAVTAQAPQYLFSDTINFLENLKQQGEELILLSLGDPEFQEIKINGSGIHNYFNRVFMVDRTKIKVLEELLPNISASNIWFINDKVGETLELVKEFKQLKAVLKISQFLSIKEYQDSGLPFFETLTEILKYVESK